jgi:hypothetical protein
MKKLMVVVILLLITVSPVFAFSVRNFLIDFGDFFKNSITGAAAPPPVCTEQETRCGYSSECGGSPCIMSCQNNQWIEYQYCAYQCSDGQCISSPPVCTEQETRCGYSSECGGSPCIMSCQNNQWIEYQYCAYQCSDGQCISSPPTTPQQCSDGTLHNQCSSNKPYFCNNNQLINDCNTCGCPSGKQCTNNQCTEIGPYDPRGEEGDEDDLNIAPIIAPIAVNVLKVGEIIQFNIRAIDPDSNILNYNIESSEIVSCSISNKVASCKGVSPGEGKIKLIVSDGKDESRKEISVKVIPKLYELKKGIAAGLGNTLPTADAGPDKIGIPGKKIILDASRSYDKEGLLSNEETYQWYENDGLIDSGKIIEKIFALGTHEIKLIVSDSEGLTDEDALIIIIKEKTACKNTQTIYYPEDTICNSKWPTHEGEEIKINSQEFSCNLFEVCSDDIDPIIEESISCCTEGLTDPSKAQACNFANENSNNFKNCQALYVIKSLGRSAVYVEGYFDAEMCCKGVDALCPDESYLYTSQPLPEYLRGVQCSNTPDNNPNGKWRSDTKLEFNEIALFDAPAHSTLDIIKTGTCVDYSTSATTLLRKIGYSAKDILSVEASNHAYNLVRFDLDRKYTIFDMTGNNEGLVLGKVPAGYDYCESIINCYNDLGKVPCPSNEEIYGCEGKQQKVGRKAQDVGFKATGIFSDLYEKIKFEVLR